MFTIYLFAETANDSDFNKRVIDLLNNFRIQKVAKLADSKLVATRKYVVDLRHHLIDTLAERQPELAGNEIHKASTAALKVYPTLMEKPNLANIHGDYFELIIFRYDLNKVSLVLFQASCCFEERSIR